MFKSITIRRGLLMLVALITLVGPLQYGRKASADSGPCEVQLLTHSVAPAENSELTIRVTNNGSASVGWVGITLPSILKYIGNSITGWATADRSDGVDAYGGAIAPGDSFDFRLQVYGNLAPGAANVSVQATDDQSGIGATGCSGDSSISVNGHPNPDSAYGTNDISVDAIGMTSATVHWVSDVDTSSIVYYGKSDAYGAVSSYDSVLNSQHAVTIGGLDPGTTYHFQVAGTDDQGTYMFSSDNTFVTQPRLSGASGNPGASNSPGPTNSLLLKTLVKTESIPPSIRVDTQLVGAYRKPPVMSGVASDNAGIERVEYSTDGGRNWLSVDSISGGSERSFSFTPTVIEDGDYTLIVRAVDTSGNMTSSPAQNLVIDMLPPTVGGVLLQSGSQSLVPDKNGVFSTAQGIDQDVTLGAVGGATRLTLTATATQDAKKTQSFSLTRSESTGLWAGAMNFRSPGTYTLVAHAVDGAANMTERTLFNFSVSAKGLVTDQTSKKPLQALIDIYTKDSETGDWVLWDASSYDQSNPVVTNREGEYGLYLPAGTYYLKVASPGYRQIVSRSFTLDSPQVVSHSLQMQQVISVGKGASKLTLPVWTTQQMVDDVKDQKQKPEVQLRDFTATLSTGEELTATGLLGKPTLITFVTMWSPTSQDQLALASELAANPEINVVVVGIGEGPSKLDAYLRLGGYSVRAVADQHNQLAAMLGVSVVPSHLSVDRYGMIKEYSYGLLSKKELMNTIIRQEQ